MTVGISSKWRECMERYRKRCRYYFKMNKFYEIIDEQEFFDQESGDFMYGYWIN